MMEFEEEMGESASPPDDPSLSPRAITRDICNRLVEDDSKQGIRNYRLREELKSHFYRLPDRCIDVFFSSCLFTVVCM